jgi:hypothetical protein
MNASERRNVFGAGNAPALVDQPLSSTQGSWCCPSAGSSNEPTRGPNAGRTVMHHDRKLAVSAASAKATAGNDKEYEQELANDARESLEKLLSRLTKEDFVNGKILAKQCISKYAVGGQHGT